MKEPGFALAPPAPQAISTIIARISLMLSYSEGCDDCASGRAKGPGDAAHCRKAELRKRGRKNAMADTGDEEGTLGHSYRSVFAGAQKLAYDPDPIVRSFA